MGGMCSSQSSKSTSISHNCVPRQIFYSLKIAKKLFEIKGVLYGQQNQLNKACAQVALRSLFSLHIPLRQITYARINKIASKVKSDPGQPSHYDPKKGLSVKRIRAVLKGFNIGFSDIDYSEENNKFAREIPYQKLIYSGIESGCGALLGFKMETRKGKTQHHSIPFFGHTFNQDTWVANASSAYFKVGGTTQYLPSETWLSSFIGHDDNFGSDFCVPRLYLKPQQVKYALAILPAGVKYDGVRAETIASDYLYSLMQDKYLSKSSSKWVKRFYDSAEKQEVVLRAISLSNEEYTNHLLTMRDWDNHRFPPAISFLTEMLKKQLWMVEISLPEIFPINKRKLGEIILDATAKPKSKKDYRSFLFARFPSIVFFPAGKERGKSKFLAYPSSIESHTELYLKCQ